jgi:hypothetical protein
MRRRSNALALTCAEQMRPLLPLAKKAYGQQKQGSPARTASDRVNQLLLAYDQAGGNITELAEHLEGDISLAGLRRRVRVARAGTVLGSNTGKSFRGSRDPAKVKAAVAKIEQVAGTPYYGTAIKKAYQDGIALSAIAEELDISYYTAWSAMSTS